MSMITPPLNTSLDYRTPSKASIPSSPLAPLTKSDKTEIHQSKMWAAGLASIPLIGFFKPIWDSLFYHPEKAAVRRSDVLAGKRSLADAKRLEQEKKKSQIKAALLPASIMTVGFMVFERKFFKLFATAHRIRMRQQGKEVLQMKETNLLEQLKNIYNIYKTKPHRTVLPSMYYVSFQRSIFQLLNFITPLGLYFLFEKPESPDFNKGL